MAVRQLAELTQNCSLLIGSRLGRPMLSREIVCGLPADAILIGIGGGSLAEDAVQTAIARGMRVLRLDMRAGLSGQVMTVLESKELWEKVMGRGTLGGVPVVAGGELGERGTVVVDSISTPAKVLSVADGKGGLLDEAAAIPYRDRIDSVSREILRRRIEG